MSGFDLSGSIGIVTGGCSGIGRTIVETLAREGAQVNLRNATPDDLRDIRAQWLDVPEGYAACLAWSAERAL